METAINHEYINFYAEAYTNRIVDRFFSENTMIDGENILDITEIRQINLFIIKNIMVKWEDEAKKLRSPFFNYAAPEVQNALQDFMNELSKHISIDQKVFKPLLRMSIVDTLMLIFSPYEFFSNELLTIGTPVTLTALEKRRKFIKINSELYNVFLQRVEMSGADNMQIKEAKQNFDQVCEEINFSPEEPDEYISLFSKEISFEIKKVYAEVERSSEENNGNGDIQNDKVPIHEKYYEQKATLVDELKKDASSTVLDFHKKQRIDSIKKNISIQQRFRFVRELFDEKDETFNETIEYLDNCSSNEEASSYLNERYLVTGQWSNEDEVVAEFLAVINKKFPDQ